MNSRLWRDYLRGQEMASAFDREVAEIGVGLLKRAYEAGVREAGYELAMVRGRGLDELTGLSDLERAELHEEQALDGYASAALDLCYHSGLALSEGRVRAAMQAARANSAEVDEILDRPGAFDAWRTP